MIYFESFDCKVKQITQGLLLQKFKVNVLLAERKSRRLILSVKPKEKEELVEKKRKLMVRPFMITFIVAILLLTL